MLLILRMDACFRDLSVSQVDISIIADVPGLYLATIILQGGNSRVDLARRYAGLHPQNPPATSRHGVLPQSVLASGIFYVPALPPHLPVH
jgi:hypothetical protein